MRPYLFISAFAVLTHATVPLYGNKVLASRDQAWTPAETLASIELDGPYEAQLVAAEPLIVDPVEMCWDAQGRCYVADMRDYPLGGPDGKPISRIQQLIDTDQDGVFDKAITFADHLDHAQGLLPYRDGLIVTTRTQILFLRDTDNDGIADETKPLVAGFNPSFSQLQISSPRYGLDGDVYFNNGLDSKEIYPVISNDKNKEASKLNIARHNLRWNPYSNELHAASGFGQFGGAFDDWGRHYYSSNRSPVMFSILPLEALMNRPRSGLTQTWENIAPHGPDSRVYPLQITHTTSDAHSGTNTSACGIAVYRGDLMPELHGNFFVCDPTGQLITRFTTPKPKGASLTTQRTGAQTEFFRSRDEWCRPVNITTGPDGALYVCDIYRQYIDHARFFPEEFVKKHDMRSGEHQGRIWRIVPKGYKAKYEKHAAPKDLKSLAGWLRHNNAWQRETAQRAILENAKTPKDAEAYVRAISNFSRPAQNTPAHAKASVMWTAAIIWSHFESDISSSFASDLCLEMIKDDPRPELIENLVLINSRIPRLFADKQDEVKELAFTHGDTRSRTLYLALTSADKNKVTAELDAISTFTEALEDPWFQSAVLGRYPEHGGHLLGKLASSKFIEVSSSEKSDFIRKLSVNSAFSNKLEDFSLLLACLRIESAKLTWWKPALLKGLSEGLPKSDGAIAGKSLKVFINSSDAAFVEPRQEIKTLLTLIDQVLADNRAPLDQRLACLPLLAQRPFDETQPVFRNLLGNHQPPELSSAAFASLKNYGAARVAPLLYDMLPSSSPALRQQMVALLTASQTTAIELFQRMERGEVARSLVDAETRWRYLQSKDATVKALAESLFQQPSSDRAAVISTYLPSAKKKGDAAKGQQVFNTACIICHSFRGQGIAVGPDISDVRAKEKEALLSDILDPNRMIEARWSAYQIETKDGRILVGLLDSETAEAVNLKLPGGHQETVSREQIASQKSLDASLMPVGLEASITPEQMSDLLSYLRGE